MFPVIVCFTQYLKKNQALCIANICTFVNIYIFLTDIQTVVNIGKHWFTSGSLTDYWRHNNLFFVFLTIFTSLSS